MEEDLELKAIKTITGALEELGEEQRRGVLLYINNRYRLGGRESEITATGPAHRQLEDVATSHSDIGDFFDAVDPATEAERVLVGAYWVQVVEGAEEFESAQVNKHLKNLGHPVSNITRALDSMMTQSPRLVLQTQKSGTSKQARKRYKVTRAGTKKIQSMISREGENE